MYEYKLHKTFYVNTSLNIRNRIKSINDIKFEKGKYIFLKEDYYNSKTISDKIRKIILEEIIEYLEQNFSLDYIKLIDKRENISNKKELQVFLSQAFYENENLIKEILNEVIFDFFNYNKEISIKGFLYFRMKDVYELIEKIALKALNDYKLIKAYDEFIEIMRSFLLEKDPKKNHLKICIKDNDIKQILDNKNKNRKKEYLSLEHIYIKEEMTFEDEIINILLNVYPTKVTIVHNINEERISIFLSLLKDIFEENIRIYLKKDESL
ncbi:sporulation protein YtxC [Peptostreptococcaceae bacterium AGR-M142]